MRKLLCEYWNVGLLSLLIGHTNDVPYLSCFDLEIRASDIIEFRNAPLLEELFDILKDVPVFCILELKVAVASDFGNYCSLH